MAGMVADRGWTVDELPPGGLTIWDEGSDHQYGWPGPDDFLNGKILYTLREAQVLVGSWRRHYNEVKPHCSLGYTLPVLQTKQSTMNWVVPGVQTEAKLMALQL